LTAVYREFKPRLARNLHLVDEEKALSRPQINDFPEVQAVADPESVRITAPPAQSGTGEQDVNEPPQPP